MSTATGFALAWRNHVFTDPAGEFELLSGDVTVGSLDLLRDMRLSKRVTISESVVGAGSAVIQLVWNADPDITAQVIGLLNYSLSAPDATSVNWQVVVYYGGAGSISAPVDVFERPSEDFPAHLFHVLSEPLVGVYEVRLIIEAVFGGGGGTLAITIGALWVGPMWRPESGFDATWQIAVIDRGVMGRSEGNQGYPRRRQRYRSYSGRAVNVPFTWAFGDESDPSILDMQQLQYRVGLTEPVVLFPRTRNSAGEISTHVIHRLAVYGHFAEMGAVEHLGGDLYQWAGARVDELM